MTAILQGIRIVDLTAIVAGPYATMLLADLGADVIRVEAPGGDGYRAAPPGRHPGMGAPFLTINRGKRSVGLDLRTDGGREVLHALVRGADVAVHNQRPEPARRLGIDAAALTALNSRLVHAVTTGFGADGPDADRPAYDDIVQARSGLASLLADGDGAPRLAPTILADKVTGLQLANAVLAALLHRERTGQALTVEVPMLETMAAFLMAEHMGGRAFDPPLGDPGYNRLLSPGRRPHRTADGWIVVLPYTTRHWQAFLVLADLGGEGWEDVVADPDQRAARIDELYALVGRVLPRRPSSWWLRACAEVDVPAGPVRTLEGLLADPHLTAVGMFPVVEHPTEGRVRLPRSPVRYGGVAPSAAGPAPRPAADTRQVLSELGLEAAEVEGWIAAGDAWTDDPP